MCSAKIGVPKKPWKAELPCGEKVLLTEEETVGEGSKCLDDGGCNCGFLAFGKSRDDVADCLTFEMLNDASRQVMASEIRQGLQGLSGLESGVQAPFHERIKQGVNDDCITEAEVEKYVAALRGGRLWLGHQGALLYAMHNRISLYIWEKNSSNCLELKLVNHHHCESRSKVIHMLSTGTHLNRLSCSPDLAVDEHKAAHAMIKKTSWNRGKIMIIAATVAFTLLSIIFGYSIQLHEERDQTPSNLFPKISQAGTALCKELHSFPEKETICLQKLEQEEAMVRAFVQTMTEGAVAVFPKFSQAKIQLLGDCNYFQCGAVVARCAQCVANTDAVECVNCDAGLQPKCESCFKELQTALSCHGKLLPTKFQIHNKIYNCFQFRVHSACGMGNDGKFKLTLHQDEIWMRPANMHVRVDVFDGDCLMWSGRFYVGVIKKSVDWPGDFGDIEELKRSYRACGQSKDMLWDGSPGTFKDL